MATDNLAKTRITFLTTGLVVGIALTFLILNFIGHPKSEETVCGLTTMPQDVDSLGYISNTTHWPNETERYQKANANGIWGGRIGKDYLIAIINSLGAEKDVHYKFALDNQDRVFIVVQGGMHNPVSGTGEQRMYFARPGTSFCPPYCGNPVPPQTPLPTPTPTPSPTPTAPPPGQ